MPHTYPDVTVVDENDSVIGAMQLTDAMSKGLIVRVAHVLVVNENKEMLLQKRSEHVWYPNLWNASAAGHVDANESYEECAVRELAEEMGIAAQPEDMQLILKVLYTAAPKFMEGKKFHAAFLLETSDEVQPDPTEVSGYRWSPIAEIKHEIKTSPEYFLGSFIAVFNAYLEKFGE